MFRIFFLILASYGSTYEPTYQLKQLDPQEATEPAEFGDCIQLPNQKTLGDE